MSTAFSQLHRNFIYPQYSVHMPLISTPMPLISTITIMAIISCLISATPYLCHSKCKYGPYSWTTTAQIKLPAYTRYIAMHRPISYDTLPHYRLPQHHSTRAHVYHTSPAPRAAAAHMCRMRHHHDDLPHNGHHTCYVMLLSCLPLLCRAMLIAAACISYAVP